MKNKLALVVAVVLGLIAVYGIARWHQGEKQKYEQKFRTVRVAAAGKRIPAGTVMDRTCLLSEETKDGKVLLGIEKPETAVTGENIMVGDEDRLIGLTINRTVERGDDLLVSYFRQPVEKLDTQLHLGERAITLRVDAITGVAANLTPGSHVDIIGTFPLAQQPGAAAPMKAAGAAASRTLLLFQNVTIIAVDNRTRDEDFVAERRRPALAHVQLRHGRGDSAGSQRARLRAAVRHADAGAAAARRQPAAGRRDRDQRGQRHPEGRGRREGAAGPAEEQFPDPGDADALKIAECGVRSADRRVWST